MSEDQAQYLPIQDLTQPAIQFTKPPALYTVDLTPIITRLGELHDELADAAGGFESEDLAHDRDIADLRARIDELNPANFAPVKHNHPEITEEIARQANSAEHRVYAETLAREDAILNVTGLIGTHGHTEFADLAKAIEEHPHAGLVSWVTEEMARIDHTYQTEVAALKARIDELKSIPGVTDAMLTARSQAMHGEVATLETRVLELEKHAAVHGHKDSPTHKHTELADADHGHEGLGHNHSFAKPEVLKDKTLVYRCTSPGCTTVFTVGG